MSRRVWSIIIALPLLGACSQAEEEDRHDDTDRLFHGINSLAVEYAAKIRQAPDSASATGAFEEFQAELDSLNFSVEADTDLLLTEGENDTIFNNLINVRKIYDNKLRNLKILHKDTEEP